MLFRKRHDGAVRCAGIGAFTWVIRAERADGPQGTEANGDELMASEPWSIATASGSLVVPGIWKISD